jgi:CDP-paratose 2-epimerase
MRILITGGAGFVGSNLALLFKRDQPATHVTVFDNLKRRGSETNLQQFKQHGIKFVHGDIRHRSDLDDLEGNFDVLIEASAEPSVLAGVNGSARYLLDTNLGGTLNCMEFARTRAPLVLFLSTSRVYSIAPLKDVPLREDATRFEIDAACKLPGASSAGIAEHFPTDRARSFYGATKLASELLIHEYVESAGVKAVINRCSVIAGPGQFGKVDQGVFTLWAANHYFKKPLKYTGFGGTGKQVRDLLHPADLYEVLKLQLERISACSGQTYNVGGGRPVSTSLLELTALCRELSGNSVAITSAPDSSSVDIPLFLSDSAKVKSQLGWQPRKSTRDIFADIFTWLKSNESVLKSIFG